MPSCEELRRQPAAAIFIIKPQRDLPDEIRKLKAHILITKKNTISLLWVALATIFDDIYDFLV